MKGYVYLHTCYCHHHYSQILKEFMPYRLFPFPGLHTNVDASSWNLHLCVIYCGFFKKSCDYYCFDRVCAPPHAAVRGGVPAVCLPLDEQPPDEGAATTLHDQTVGHLPGTNTHTHTTKLQVLFFLLSVHFYLSGSAWSLRNRGFL